MTASEMTQSGFKKLIQTLGREDTAVQFDKKGAEIWIPLPPIAFCEQIVAYPNVWRLQIGLNDRHSDFEAISFLVGAWRKSLSSFEIQDFTLTRQIPSLPLRNPFTKTFDEVVARSKLKSFRANGVILADSTLEAVCSRSTLRELSLYCDKLGKEACRILSGAKKLKELSISNCTGITGEMIEQIHAALPHVRLYVNSKRKV